MPIGARLRGLFRRRWKLMVGSTVALLLSLYLGVFAFIWYHSTRDYERLRDGVQPQWALGHKGIVVADGGTIGLDGFGYTLWRIKREEYPPESPDEPQMYMVGEGLEFTCRAYFPVLQRLLHDREEVTGPVEDRPR